MEEFEFYVGDVLIVCGEDKDFYVCCVFEDVIGSVDNFRVVWFNRLVENLYEVSIQSLFLVLIVQFLQLNILLCCFMWNKKLIKFVKFVYLVIDCSFEEMKFILV